MTVTRADKIQFSSVLARINHANCKQPRTGEQKRLDNEPFSIIDQC